MGRRRCRSRRRVSPPFEPPAKAPGWKTRRPARMTSTCLLTALATSPSEAQWSPGRRKGPGAIEVPQPCPTEVFGPAVPPVIPTRALRGPGGVPGPRGEARGVRGPAYGADKRLGGLLQRLGSGCGPAPFPVGESPQLRGLAITHRTVGNEGGLSMCHLTQDRIACILCELTQEGARCKPSSTAE